MTFGRLAVVALAVAALVASPASAEVRLSNQGGVPTLVVEPTPQGVWTPIGPPDSNVLNTAGDVLGDGAPGHAVQADSILAAWHRPVTDSIELALWQPPAAAWRAAGSTLAPGAFGTPKVIRLGGTAADGWLVAYTVGLKRPTITLVGVTPDGRATLSAPVIDGLLVDVVRVDDGIHVLGVTIPVSSLSSGRIATLEATTLALTGISVPDLPIPVTRISTVALDSFAFTAAGTPIRSGRTTVRQTGPAGLLIPSHPTTIGRGADLGLIRAHSGTRTTGAPFALVTWWQSPHQLHFAELVEGGPLSLEILISPVTSPPYQQPLVDDAVDTVRVR